jgi:hypothetical protein
MSIGFLHGSSSSVLGVSLQLLKYCSRALFASKIVRICPEIGRKVGTMASMLQDTKTIARVSPTLLAILTTLAAQTAISPRLCLHVLTQSQYFVENTTDGTACLTFPLWEIYVLQYTDIFLPIRNIIFHCLNLLRTHVILDENYVAVL